jgi:hypothetical protein
MNISRILTTGIGIDGAHGQIRAIDLDPAYFVKN